MLLSVRNKLVFAYMSIVVVALSLGFNMLIDGQKINSYAKTVNYKNLPARNALIGIKMSFLEKNNAFLKSLRGETEEAKEIWNSAEVSFSAEIIKLKSTSLIGDGDMLLLMKANEDINKIGKNIVFNKEKSFEENLIQQANNELTKINLLVKPILERVEKDLTLKMNDALLKN